MVSGNVITYSWWQSGLAYRSLFWLLDDFRGYARFEPISTKYGRVNFLACEKVTEVASFLGSPACRQINMQVRHLTE